MPGARCPAISTTFATRPNLVQHQFGLVILSHFWKQIRLLATEVAKPFFWPLVDALETQPVTVEPLAFLPVRYSKFRNNRVFHASNCFGVIWARHTLGTLACASPAKDKWRSWLFARIKVVPEEGKGSARPVGRAHPAPAWPQK